MQLSKQKNVQQKAMKQRFRILFLLALLVNALSQMRFIKKCLNHLFGHLLITM